MDANMCGRAFLTAVCLFALTWRGEGYKIRVFQREVNLQSYVAIIGEGVEFTDTQPKEEVTLCYKEAQFNAAVLIRYWQPANDTLDLEYSIIDKDSTGAPPGVLCVLVKMNNSAGGTQQFMSRMVLKGSQVSSPQAMSQREPHLVLFSTSLMVISPYPIQQQSLQFQLQSEDVREFTPAPGVRHVRDQVQCGPYQSEGAWSEKDITVHFVNHAPFLHIDSMHREIQVSHWGNVYVEEQYRVHNAAAPLTEGFSRFDYMLDSSEPGPSAHISAITASLPRHAKHLYFKDLIGNISSSNTRFTTRSVNLVMRPRYPLMGGWVTEFTLGYSLPLESCVTKVKGRHSLRFSFAPPFDQFYMADTVTTRIVLPEGSSDLQVHSPSSLSLSDDESLTYTYLDTIGRPTKVLSMKNVVKDHKQKVRVSYHFNSLYAFQEPLLCSLVFLMLFLVSIFTSRMDLTIAKDAKWLTAQKQQKQLDSLVHLRSTLTSLSHVFNMLESMADSFPVGVSDGSAETANAEATFESCQALLTQLNDVRTALEQESATNVKAVSALYQIQIQLLDAYKELIRGLLDAGAGGVSRADSRARFANQHDSIAVLQENADLLKEAVLAC